MPLKPRSKSKSQLFTDAEYEALILSAMRGKRRVTMGQIQAFISDCEEMRASALLLDSILKKKSKVIGYEKNKPVYGCGDLG